MTRVHFQRLYVLTIFLFELYLDVRFLKARDSNTVLSANPRSKHSLIGTLHWCSMITTLLYKMTDREKRKGNQLLQMTYMVKGESGLGFVTAWHSSSTGLSAGRAWGMLFTNTDNGGGIDPDGALGDGDVGGLRSSYLRTLKRKTAQGSYEMWWEKVSNWL